MAASTLTPQALLARLAALTSRKSGLDASLMLVQYSSPLVVALLLALARLRARAAKIPLGVQTAQAAQSSASAIGARTAVRVMPGAGVRRVAEGWAKVGGGIGEARVVMRAFQLLPYLQWLLSLHPHPLASLLRLVTAPHKVNLESPKTLPTLQALSLLAYAPLEHFAWLGSKGVITVSPTTLARASTWSCRFWAAYVFITIHQLRGTYVGLVRERRALARREDEKDEGAKADGRALAGKWMTWATDCVTNAAYLPLTLHWSTPSGLWTNPLITASLGTAAALSQLSAEWRKE
ncbi:hypothetical protein Q5752_001441 [Cryptotrichosporon argae]